MAGPDYLPPVVISILGDISDLVKKIAEAKALLKDLEKPVVVPVTLDMDPAIAEAEAGRALIESILSRPIVMGGGVNSSLVPTALASLGGGGGGLPPALAALQMEQMVADITSRARKQYGYGGGNGDPGFAFLASEGNPIAAKVLQDAQFLAYRDMSPAAFDAMMAARGNNSSGLGRGIGEAVLAQRRSGGIYSGGLGQGLADAYLASEKQKGGGFNLGALIGMGLLGDRTTPLGGLGALNPLSWKMAGFGSALSFAGLGSEHVLATGIGLAGSLTAGIGGAGVLAGGALASLAVGAGSDAGILKSTIGDTTNYATALSNLQEALAVYGAGSNEAAAAQYALNASLGNASPAAKNAEKALAAAGSALDAQFDKSTSGARIQAATFLESIVHLGAAFLPKVASAAQSNITEINKGLKPLFSWLEGPNGMGVWDALEKHFRTNLPYAIGAFTNAIEILLKLLEFLADKSTSFMKNLDARLALDNTSSGISRLEGHINNMIQAFHTWAAFFEALFKVIRDLFKQDAGFAQSLIGYLTQLLNQLDAYETSASGSKAIHSVFETHKKEIMEIIQLLPDLIGSFGQLYLAIAPVATMVLTQLVTPLVTFVTWVSKNPFGAWALGIAAVLYKLGPLKSAISTMFGELGKMSISILNTIPGVNLTGGSSTVFSAATKVFAEAVALFRGEVVASDAGAAASDSGGIVGILTGLLSRVGIGAAGAEGGIIAGILASPLSILAAAAAGIAVLGLALTHLTQIGNIIQNIGNFFSGTGIGKDISDFADGIGHWFETYNFEGLGKSIGSAISAFGIRIVDWISQIWTPPKNSEGQPTGSKTIGVTYPTPGTPGQPTLTLPTNTSSGLANTWNQINNWFDNALKSGAKTALKAVAYGFADIADFIVGVVAGLTPLVKTVFGPIVNWFENSPLPGIFQSIANAGINFANRILSVFDINIPTFGGSNAGPGSSLGWTIVNGIAVPKNGNTTGSGLGYVEVGGKFYPTAGPGITGTQSGSGATPLPGKTVSTGSLGIHPSVSVTTHVTVPNGTPQSQAKAVGDAISKEVNKQLTNIVRGVNSGAYAVIPG